MVRGELSNNLGGFASFEFCCSIFITLLSAFTEPHRLPQGGHHGITVLSELPMEHAGAVCPLSRLHSKTDNAGLCVCVLVGDNVVSPHPSPTLEACVPEAQRLSSLLWSQFLTCIMGTRALRSCGDVDRMGLDRRHGFILDTVPRSWFSLSLVSDDCSLHTPQAT